MKNSILIFFLFCLLIQYHDAFAQWECSTPDTSENMSYNMAISNMSNFHPRAFDDVALRVYYHVIRKSDQSGGHTYTQVQESFNILQSSFNEHGIFFAWDCKVNYIDSDSYYFPHATGTPIFEEVNNLDGIDIFIFPTSNSYRGGRANGVGSNSQFLVSGSHDGKNIALTKVVSHEMGHVLFLWHTFQGCPDDNWELTNGSNCHEAGDYVCDTPADPHINFNVSKSSCEWDGVALPYCALNAPEPLANYNPDPTNLMTYTVLDCMGSFTTGQGQRMRNAIDELDFLQQCIVSEPFVYENYNCIPSPVFSTTSCLELIDDLQDLHLNYIPIGFQLIFGNEIDPDSPTFSEVDPNITASGTYFGFYFNPSTNHYGPPSDPIIIKVCCEFDNDIVLTESVVFNTCPELFVNLNNYYTSTPPEDAILVWSTSSDPESEPFPIIDPFIIHEQTTTFYAYYYNAEADCYSEPSAGIEVTIRSCCSETENVYISGNVNYENPMSIGGNILIEDQGTLTITSYLELGGDKGIYVENGGKLIIEGQDAILTVCNPPTNLWNGISVKPGSELETRGGKILNAKNGIDAQMGLFSPTQPLIDIQGIEIIGNSLPNSRGISLYGVTALNLSEIIVEGYTYGVWMWGGSDLHLISQSEFKNIGYTGIYSVFNNFIVNHCIFQDSDVGVLAQHNNFGIINESSFSDLTTGIRTWHSNKMTIQNNQLYLKSVPDSRGIFLFDSPQSIISNNSAIEAEHYGILAINSPGVWIENNFISKEDDTSPTPTGGAISLVNSSSSTVMDNNINAERSIYGIEANNSHKVLITGNNIQNQLGQTVINLIGSMGVITYSNSLIGSQLCFYGINLSNSAGNEIRCNNIENCNYGLHVSHNSEYQNILGNVLDNTEDLTIRSEIGIQPFHGNLFIGGVTSALGLDADQLQNSLFYVNSEHNYHMPTDPNPGNGEWFIDIANPDFYECPDSTNIPDPELWTPFSNDSLDLCQYYQHLKTLDTLKPNKFFLGVYDLWFLSESRQDFSLPACILSDSDFQNLCGMQELAGVALDLDQLGQHELATDSLVSYQQQWLDATDSTVQTQLESIISEELDSLHNDFQAAREQDSILRTSIESDLNAISCSSILVNTWKGIYHKYLSFLHAGKVDSADYNTLRQYSSLCSDIYGKPIHLARAVTATFDTTYYAQYDNCLQGMEQRIIREQTVKTNIKVWPNPTTASVQIELPENYSGKMIITDMLGRKLKTFKIENGSLDFVEMPGENGMYLLNFFSVKGQFEQHKIMVVK